MRKLRRVRNWFIVAAAVAYAWHLATYYGSLPWWADPGYGLVIWFVGEAAYRQGRITQALADADVIASGRLPEIARDEP